MSAYFGRADTYKDASVRSVLSSLFRLAEKYNAAFVCIMHLNKGNASKAVYRTMGSLAFPAAARTVWLVAGDPSDSESPKRYLLPAKHNVLRNPTPLSFEIKDNAVVFDNPGSSQPITLTAEDVLAPQGGIDAPERNRCVQWLKEILSNGPVPSKELSELAKENGFKEGTLYNAKKELGVNSWPVADNEGNQKWYIGLSKPQNKLLMIPGLAKEIEKANEKLKNLKSRCLTLSSYNEK
jgi:hypothetical protein